jgi:hypothetical protein
LRLHGHKVKNRWTLVQDCDNDDTVITIVIVQNEESIVIFKSGVNFHRSKCAYLRFEATLVEI